ncbi:hypothetical protein X975_13052, partial [Stegodyphus mimosarum]
MLHILLDIPHRSSTGFQDHSHRENNGNTRLRLSRCNLHHLQQEHFAVQ